MNSYQLLQLLLAGTTALLYTKMPQLFQHNARQLHLSNLSLGTAARHPVIRMMSAAYKSARRPKSDWGDKFRGVKTRTIELLIYGE